MNTTDAVLALIWGFIASVSFGVWQNSLAAGITAGSLVGFVLLLRGSPK